MDKRYIRYINKAFLDPRYAAKVGMMRGKSMLSRQFSDGKSAFPETVSLYLTYKCNLRCKMCGQWNEEEGSSNEKSCSVVKEEMNLEAYRKLFADLSKFKPNVTLFGGEPLVLKNFFEIVKEATNFGLRVNMISNMALAYNKAEEIVKSGLDEIIVSIDGPRDIHDQVRGVKGTFNKLIKSIMLINQIKKSLKVDTPKINISTTITKLNVNYLTEIIEIAEFIGAKSLTYHNLIHISETTYKKSEKIFKEEFNVAPEDFAGFILNKELWDIDGEKLIKIIEKIKSKKSNMYINIYPDFTDDEIRRYYTDEEFSPDSFPHRCVSPWITVYVFPDGSIRPCLSTNFTPGNIKDDSFENIWNNSEFIKFRRDLKSRKYYPFCSKCTEMYRF